MHSRSIVAGYAVGFVAAGQAFGPTTKRLGELLPLELFDASNPDAIAGQARPTDDDGASPVREFPLSVPPSSDVHVRPAELSPAELARLAALAAPSHSEPPTTPRIAAAPVTALKGTTEFDLFDDAELDPWLKEEPPSGPHLPPPLPRAPLVLPAMQAVPPPFAPSPQPAAPRSAPQVEPEPRHDEFCDNTEFDDDEAVDTPPFGMRFARVIVCVSRELRGLRSEAYVTVTLPGGAVVYEGDADPNGKLDMTITIPVQVDRVSALVECGSKYRETTILLRPSGITVHQVQ